MLSGLLGYVVWMKPGLKTEEGTRGSGASLSYVSLFLFFFFSTFLFHHISRCLPSLFCFALFPINPPRFTSPSTALLLLSTPISSTPSPPPYRIPISHYVSCMCLRVIRHKAGAKQPNEQTPALCWAPGDPPELLMYNSSDERRQKKNPLTRSQISAQRKSCNSQRSPGRQPGSARSEDLLSVLPSKDFLTRQYVALSCSSNWQKRRRPLTLLLRTAYLILESMAAKTCFYLFFAGFKQCCLFHFPQLFFFPP